MTIEIPLTGRHGDGRRFIVDDDMADLEAYRWCANGGSPGRYACRKSMADERARGAPTMVYAHRIIAERIFGRAVRGALVDHINRDSLDNRRDNLRLADYRVNAQNADGVVLGVSRFRGVTYDPASSPAKPWRARIRIPGRRRIGGNHRLETDAAREYDALALLHYGPNAWTNEAAGLFGDAPVPAESRRWCSMTTDMWRKAGRQ